MIVVNLRLILSAKMATNDLYGKYVSQCVKIVETFRSYWIQIQFPHNNQYCEIYLNWFGILRMNYNKGMYMADYNLRQGIYTNLLMGDDIKISLIPYYNSNSNINMYRDASIIQLENQWVKQGTREDI